MLRAGRVLLAFITAFALLPAVTAAAHPPKQHADAAAGVTWSRLPHTRLPGFDYENPARSIAMSGSGGNAFVLGTNQLVKLNTNKSPATVIWRATNVKGTDVVMNPKHQIAYITTNNTHTLRAVNTFYASKPKITKSFTYRCGAHCGITDVAITRSAKYLLVGLSDIPGRVDIYSLANPWKPKRVGHYKMRLDPEAIAPTPNGRYLVVQGVAQDNVNQHKYMVLNIRRPKHVTITKHRTRVHVDRSEAIVPAPGGAHMYLIGEDTANNVYIDDVKPGGHWPITRRKKVLSFLNTSVVSGADITTSGKYIYIARPGIESEPVVCMVGFAHLRRAKCYTNVDFPFAGVALSKAGKTRDRAYFTEGTISKTHTWLDVLSSPK